MSLLSKVMRRFGVGADDDDAPLPSLLKKSEEGLPLTEVKNKLSDAVNRHVATSAGLVRATRRSSSDAEFVKITVDSVLARAEQAARDRNDA